MSLEEKILKALPARDKEDLMFRIYFLHDSPKRTDETIKAYAKWFHQNDMPVRQAWWRLLSEGRVEWDNYENLRKAKGR